MHCLMITTAVWVVNRVHGDSRDAGVGLASRLCFLVCSSCLQQWFISTSMAGYHSDGCTTFRRDHARSPGRHSNTNTIGHAGLNDGGHAC